MKQSCLLRQCTAVSSAPTLGLWAPFPSWPKHRSWVAGGCFLGCPVELLFDYSFIHLFVQTSIRLIFVLSSKLEAVLGHTEESNLVPTFILFLTFRDTVS